jgi:stress response protein YsnF
VISPDKPDPHSNIAASGRAEVTKVPLNEEVLSVSKRDVVTGRVRVRTVQESTEELVQEKLDTAQVSISRVGINRIVDEVPMLRTEGDVTIVPVLEEVLVVETKLLLKEEIHIRRTLTKETVEQAVKLRKQRAIIENLEGDVDVADDSVQIRERERSTDP